MGIRGLSVGALALAVAACARFGTDPGTTPGDGGTSLAPPPAPAPVPCTGNTCSAQKIATVGNGLLGIAVSPTSIYVSIDYTEIVEIAKSDVTKQTHYPMPQVHYLVWDAKTSSLFFALDDGPKWGQLNGTVDKGSSPAEGSIGIATADDGYYVSFANAGTVVRFNRPVDGGSVVAMDAVSGAEGIAIDPQGPTLYASGNHDGKIYAKPLQGAGQTTVLFKDLDGPAGIAAQGGFVYVAEQFGGDVSRIRADGLEKVVLYSHGASPPGKVGPSGVALDDTYVYWTHYENGEVWRAPR